MPEFIPGLELSRLFYWEIIRPLLEQHYPALPHTAALIGPGSEVLGFDTEMSMDHHWFPNVLIFLQDQDEELAGPMHEMLRWNLPLSFKGFPLHLIEIPGEPGVYKMREKNEHPVDHYVHPMTLRSYIDHMMAWDIDQPLTAADWLSLPSQVFRSITSGAVHHDGIGELSELRERMNWYPDDVWLFMLAAGWHRIDDEEHLMPRAGYIGDELGSALIGSRLVRDIMSMCFLMEKQYAPYPKWFGSAFQQLSCAVDLSPILWRVQMAEIWQEREAALGEAYQYLAGMHNTLSITEYLPEQVSSFHDRPFQVIHGEVFANAILAQIKDPHVQEIAQHTLIGSVDQISDNTKLRSDLTKRSIIRQLYIA
jgi:hypothetical protein